jgi:hypothetical protein
MRKAIIISLLLIAVVLSGCAEKIPCEPVDVEYIEAYDSMEMRYQLIYSGGGFQYMPVGLIPIHHDPVYRVRYKSVYSDGRINEYWKTVTYEEYLEAVEYMRRADNEK